MAKIVNDRMCIIKRYIQNKKVLDIGSVQHDANYEKKKEWLFKQMQKYASSITGIDNQKDGVEILQNKGYNIKYGNAENIDLNAKFDVIVAGEIIEHLSNPGIFLSNMKKHLKNKESKIIISTPNNTGFLTFYNNLILGRVPNNPEHTMWLDLQTLSELLRREDLEIEKYWYVYKFSLKSPHHTKLIPRSYDLIKSIFLKICVTLRPSFAPQMLVIIKQKIN